MVLVILLGLVGIIGIIYGITKNNGKILTASIIWLVVLIVLLLIYQYLYSQNPY